MRFFFFFFFFFLFETTKHQPRRNLPSYLVLQRPCNEAVLSPSMMHIGNKSWSKMVVSWRYADLSMECSKRVCHVHYVAIDDFVITTPLKNDITALWSRSGGSGASLLGQDVVASPLSLCMAK